MHDVAFLHGYPKPTLALLYEDTKELKHLKTYEVLLKEKDFGDGPWQLSQVRPIPSPPRRLPRLPCAPRSPPPPPLPPNEGGGGRRAPRPREALARRPRHRRAHDHALQRRRPRHRPHRLFDLQGGGRRRSRRRPLPPRRPPRPPLRARRRARARLGDAARPRTARRHVAAVEPHVRRRGRCLPRLVLRQLAARAAAHRARRRRDVPADARELREPRPDRRLRRRRPRAPGAGAGGHVLGRAQGRLPPRRAQRDRHPRAGTRRAPRHQGDVVAAQRGGGRGGGRRRALPRAVVHLRDARARHAGRRRDRRGRAPRLRRRVRDAPLLRLWKRRGRAGDDARRPPPRCIDDGAGVGVGARRRRVDLAGVRGWRAAAGGDGGAEAGDADGGGRRVDGGGGGDDGARGRVHRTRAAGGGRQQRHGDRRRRAAAADGRRRAVDRPHRAAALRWARGGWMRGARR